MTYKYCPYCAYIGIYSRCPYCGTHLIDTEQEYDSAEWSKNRLSVIHNIYKMYNVKNNDRYNPEFQQLREAEEQMRYRVMRGTIK